MAGKGSAPLTILCVTVLTNLDQAGLREMRYTCSVSELVALRARTANEVGVGGLVYSPLEVASVRAIVGPEMTVVTPGVRSAGAAAGDQKRIATPSEAIRNGATYLVIGRQVTRAPDPRAEILKITAEIA